MEIGEPTPREPYRIPLMLPQFMTEGILRERLAELGERPGYGQALEAFTQDEAGVTATVGGATLRVRYLVARTAAAAWCATRWVSAFPAGRWRCAPSWPTWCSTG